MSSTNYKNKESIVLESDRIRAELLPNPGGKLASLIDKSTGYEFFVQRPAPIYKEQPFDALYVDAECSGFDDMFPTIDECFYESFPWKGTKLADHGELWSLPWKATFDAENSAVPSVEFSTGGIRFPYSIKKRVQLINPETLHYQYELLNHSAFDFEYLWAGHMMINLQEGTKILLPDDCKEATSVLSAGSSKFGDVHQWPFLKDANGNPYRADIARNASVKGFEKLYFTKPLDQGFCKLEYPDGNRIEVQFETKNVPYLGILINEDGWDGLYNIIIEPCSICYDRPDVAKKYGQVSVLPGFSSIQWSMNIKVGD